MLNRLPKPYATWKDIISPSSAICITSIQHCFTGEGILLFVYSINHMKCSKTFSRHCMYVCMRNRRGPRHDPCGTPIVISLSFESVPLTLQNCFRLDKYYLNQESSRLRTPYSCSFGRECCGQLCQRLS